MSIFTDAPSKSSLFTAINLTLYVCNNDKDHISNNGKRVNSP